MRSLRMWMWNAQVRSTSTEIGTVKSQVEITGYGYFRIVSYFISITSRFNLVVSFSS